MCSFGVAPGLPHGATTGVSAGHGKEDVMNRSRYGMLAGIAGAAFATWWLRKRRMAGRSSWMSEAERGEVIFSNAPVAEP
jgi:hypothetical protein